jgi:hypothetical protein
MLEVDLPLAHKACELLCGYITLMRRFAGSAAQLDIPCLAVTETFAKRLLRCLCVLSTSPLEPDRLKVYEPDQNVLQTYTRCFALVPCAMSRHRIRGVRVLASPVLLVRHMLRYVLQICIRTPRIAAESRQSLIQIATELKLCHEGRKETDGYDYSILDHVAGFCEIAAGLFVDQIKSGIVPFRRDTADRLISWTICRDAAYMTQLFIIPLLSQVAVSREHWDESGYVVISLARKTEIFGINAVIIKFLTALACDRLRTQAKQSDPDSDGSINRRMWAIHILGILGVEMKEVSLFNRRSDRH